MQSAISTFAIPQGKIPWLDNKIITIIGKHQKAIVFKIFVCAWYWAAYEELNSINLNLLYLFASNLASLALYLPNCFSIISIAYFWSFRVFDVFCIFCS